MRICTFFVNCVRVMLKLELIEDVLALSCVSLSGEEYNQKMNLIVRLILKKVKKYFLRHKIYFSIFTNNKISVSIEIKANPRPAVNILFKCFN